MYIQQKHVQYKCNKGNSFKASIALFPENESSPNGIPFDSMKKRYCLCKS